MRSVLPLTVAAFFLNTPVQAQSELERGFAGAVRGCEEWVLDPASWVDGPARFISAVGLGDKMKAVDHVQAVSLPPEQLRVANHYWRINSTNDAGFILVVSDRLPMCHITGGGDVDLQPVIESVLTASEFVNRWETIKQDTKDDMVSTVFRNRKHPAFSIVISRARQPKQRLDRVQVLATAILDMSK